MQRSCKHHISSGSPSPSSDEWRTQKLIHFHQNSRESENANPSRSHLQILRYNDKRMSRRLFRKKNWRDKRLARKPSLQAAPYRLAIKHILTRKRRTSTLNLFFNVSRSRQTDRTASALAMYLRGT